jgi:UDP-N-acetylmuramate--alanine ligase
VARIHRARELLGELRLQIPGAHNVHNALAALAVAFELDVDWPTAKSALEAFSGVRRRFEVVGEFSGVTLVDDYAHHPTEVRATLEAARAGFPGHRIVALLQPHLYTRTQRFAEEFGAALLAADVAVVTDVYASRERPIPGVTGELVVDALRRRGGTSVHYMADREQLDTQLRHLLEPGDLLLALGAGDIGRITRELFAAEGASA